jgi:enamine deaminase RidA (YjgF/YER057c/UK114 family)
MKLAVLALAGACLSTPALAQPARPEAPAAGPVRIPAPGGEVILAGPGEQRAYDQIRYAAVRTAGDFVFVSGVIVGPARGGTDVESFKAGARQAFRHIERNLAAAGVTFADVVEIESFHVWNSPAFAGTRDEHFAAFSAVKDEFMKAPHPAWTAVGTTGLLADGGLVEVKVTAYKRPAR